MLSMNKECLSSNLELKRSSHLKIKFMKIQCNFDF